jgi:hypothetical protein
MDRKTLEYMEERSKVARNTVDRIENLSRQVSELKRARGTIDLYTPTKTIRLEATPYQDRAVNNYSTYAVAVIQNTFIDLATAEIQRLEEFLGEL